MAPRLRSHGRTDWGRCLFLLAVVPAVLFGLTYVGYLPVARHVLAASGSTTRVTVTHAVLVRWSSVAAAVGALVVVATAAG